MAIAGEEAQEVPALLSEGLGEVMEIILVYIPAVIAIVLSLPWVLGFFVGIAQALCCQENSDVR